MNRQIVLGYLRLMAIVIALGAIGGVISLRAPAYVVNTLLFSCAAVALILGPRWNLLAARRRRRSQSTTMREFIEMTEHLRELGMDYDFALGKMFLADQPAAAPNAVMTVTPTIAVAHSQFGDYEELVLAKIGSSIAAQVTSASTARRSAVRETVAAGV